MKILVRYTRKDVAFWERLKEGLKSNDVLTSFDIYSITDDVSWHQVIEQAIQVADIVFVVFSSNASEGSWVHQDVQNARQLGKRVVLTLADDTAPPDFLNDSLAIPFFDDFDAGLQELLTYLDLSNDAKSQPCVPSKEKLSELRKWFSAADALTELPETLCSQIAARAPDLAITAEIPAYRDQPVKPFEDQTPTAEFIACRDEPVKPFEDAILTPPSAPYPTHRSKSALADRGSAKNQTNALQRLAYYALIVGGIAAGVWFGAKLAPLLLGTTAANKPRRPEKASRDSQPVDCSVFAPPKIAAGHEIHVQVFLHPPGKAEETEAGAKRFDTHAEWRRFTSLSLELSSGTRVGVQLDAGNLLVSDNGIGEIRWNNSITGLSFLVRAPNRARPGKRHVTAQFFIDGIPAGSIYFIIEVESSVKEETPARGLGDSSHRYRKAFVSYATVDRSEVLKRVQTLQALKIDYLQDILDLEPAERWEQALYEEIERCDLFLLFWSSASKQSDWVRREAQYALACQARTRTGAPKIVPILIEGPPPPKPWPECTHLHFNDKLIYLMRDEA